MLQAITLEGTVVRLEPLRIEHLDALCQVGLDPEIWRWTHSNVRSRDDMQRYVETALTEQHRGAALPFATVERQGGLVVGSTRFGNIDMANRHLEIGWSWIAPPWQRSAINTEAKYLMLRHAFETVGCMRVEFKTDVLNTRSRQALLRIGAKEEGILRQHMITATGRLRDTVYYSILDHEWPAIKGELERKLGSRALA
jgi:RimJ/RimL family protein N-acetyltransferase